MSVAAIALANPISAPPTVHELLDRARAMIPMLKERAASVEQNRMVSPETIRAFVDAGFFKILQPARWGGWEMDPVVFWQVLMELGRGCCSSTWNMMILGLHQWEFAHMDPRAGDDVWTQDDSVIVASSYAPSGRADKVKGGYLLNGQWRTSSGTDHAQWAFIGGLIRDEAGDAVERCALLVPRSDYRIVDDWHVMGLAGTGSKSLVLENVFVPDYRTHSINSYVLTDRAVTQLYPFGTIFCGSVSAAICGFAQGAIDIYIDQMKVRKLAANASIGAAASPYVRDRLGNAVARVRSCRARLMQLMAESLPIVTRRELVPEEMRVEHILDISRVGRECAEAVLLLFPAMGARGIYLDNPMQRVVRDVLAAAQHMTQNADDSSGLIGSRLLGTELPPTAYGVKRGPPAGKAATSAA